MNGERQAVAVRITTFATKGNRAGKIGIRSRGWQQREHACIFVLFFTLKNISSPVLSVTRRIIVSLPASSAFRTILQKVMFGEELARIWKLSCTMSNRKAVMRAFLLLYTVYCIWSHESWGHFGTVLDLNVWYPPCSLLYRKLRSTVYSLYSRNTGTVVQSIQYLYTQRDQKAESALNGMDNQYTIGDQKKWLFPCRQRLNHSKTTLLFSWILSRCTICILQQRERSQYELQYSLSSGHFSHPFVDIFKPSRLELIGECRSHYFSLSELLLGGAIQVEIPTRRRRSEKAKNKQKEC